jgi:hypothetical protein
MLQFEPRKGRIFSREKLICATLFGGDQVRKIASAQTIASARNQKNLKAVDGQWCGTTQNSLGNTGAHRSSAVPERQRVSKYNATSKGGECSEDIAAKVSKLPSSLLERSSMATSAPTDECNCHRLAIRSAEPMPSCPISQAYHEGHSKMQMHTYVLVKTRI